MHLLSQWVPRFIYFMVAGYVARKHRYFYVGYFHEIGQGGWVLIGIMAAPALLFV